MRIGFFGGVREIGGNIILMESNGVGIVFDFGRRFPTSQVFFNDTIKGRPEKGFEDYVELGELPPFRGFYKNELSEEKSLPIEIGGLFFSHAHLDHIGQICYLSDSLKKYMTKGSFATLSYFVEKGIVECMPSNIEIVDGKTVQIGDFKITPYFIDHDVPGAVAYFVETPKGLVIYTGDIYFKGVKSELSNKFVEYAKSLRPYILITEGTRIGWNGIVSNTEPELKEQIKEVASVFKGLIIGNVYEIHLTRIQTFFNAASELGKKFIIHEDYASTLLKYGEFETIASEILNAPNTFVYAPFGSKLNIPKEKFVTKDELVSNQVNEILLLNFSHIPELIDIKPIEGSAYIMSGGEPLSSVDPLNTKILENWLSKFNLPLFRIHSPGHASETEILWMAKEINPEILLPIHTQIPERFKVVHANVQVLEKGILTEF
ncbi:hypothetical protein [Caldisericum sp.]|uniref:MBL fold metallo-hydrolase n=1 Tax=Caldisericum sp. TaxID=2499687 RepID=UPI003D11DDE0